MGIKKTDRLDCCKVNQIDVFTLNLNKLRTILTYRSNKNLKSLKTTGDFVKIVRGLESESRWGKSAEKKAASLWFLEKLIAEARIFNNGSFLLLDTKIERIKPALHVGWGMSAFGEIGFDFPRFSRAITNSADHKYRLLTIEPVGVIYTASQIPLRSCLMGINIPVFPDQHTLSKFFLNFSELETQALSHGYGRGLFFQAGGLCSALKKGMACPGFFEPFFSIKGIAFAYTLVNIKHLDKIFLSTNDLVANKLGREEARYFQEGISSALSFLDWHFPGLLEPLEVNAYTQKAREMVQSFQTDGGIYRI